MEADISKTLFISIFLFLVAFILVEYLTPRIIWISKKKNILSPIIDRSSHNVRTPRLGGVAIYFSILISMNLYELLSDIDVNFSSLRISLGLIFLIGLYDDIKNIKASSKLKGEIISCIPIMFDSQFYIFNDYFDGYFGYAISGLLILTMYVFITNAYNLIDGIDGLAASIGILVFFIFSILFFKAEEYFFFSLCVIFIGTLISYIKFNYKKGKLKIFLGDSGSLVIGSMLAICSIKLINIKCNSTLSIYSNLEHLVLLLGILFIPVFDTIRVILIRIGQKRNPFSADRNHLHHFFIDKKFTHIQTVFIILSINIFIVSLNLIFINFNISFFYGLLLNLLFGICLSYYIKKNKNGKKNFFN